MIEKTEFTEDTIKEEVVKNYGLEVENIEKINRGSANVFKLLIDGKYYILKEFQSKYKEKNILKEINVIKFLKEKNLIVPKYIQCLNGDFYFKYNDKIVIMQEFIEGEIKEKKTGTKKQILDSAKYLGMIVSALEDYPYDDMWGCDINRYGNIEVFKRSIKTYKELIEKAKEDKLYGERIIRDLNYKIDILNKLIEENTFRDISNVSVKKTHGDYSVMQFIYNGDEIKAIIDFVNAGELPIVWEIIRSYSFIDKDCTDGNFNISNLVLYTREYMKYAPLNEYDLKYMPYIYLDQMLNSAFGYKQYLNDGKEKLLKFGMERTNMCRYLMNNAELISEKLLEIKNY